VLAKYVTEFNVAWGYYVSLEIHI